MDSILLPIKHCYRHISCIFSCAQEGLSGPFFDYKFAHSFKTGYIPLILIQLHNYDSKKEFTVYPYSALHVGTNLVLYPLVYGGGDSPRICGCC